MNDVKIKNTNTIIKIVYKLIWNKSQDFLNLII